MGPAFHCWQPSGVGLLLYFFSPLNSVDESALEECGSHSGEAPPPTMLSSPHGCSLVPLKHLMLAMRAVFGRAAPGAESGSSPSFQQVLMRRNVRFQEAALAGALLA